MADPASPPPIVNTSIWRSLRSRMGSVHDTGKMGAFAGPPGVGKTTAIASFRRDRAGQVTPVLVRHEGATAAAILKAMLRDIRATAGLPEQHIPSGASAVEAALDRAIREWLWRAEQSSVGVGTRLSLIFDEAQVLSPKHIDMLRFWNDGTGNTPPLGIIFVGNDQFRLDTTDAGPGFLSAPVVSRTGRNRKTWTYEDITDEDVRLIAKSRGVEDPGAQDALVQHCHRSPTNRDLRQLSEDLSRLFDLAGSRPLTGELVALFLAI